MHWLNVIFRVVLLMIFFQACESPQPAAPSPIPAESRQMLLVVTPDADAFPGMLYRYERAAGQQAWQPAGAPAAIVVGYNGLGWGRGMHPAEAQPDMPIKREGDGKSPAGIFRLSTIFGFAPPDSVSGFKLPYQHVTEVLECVDDTASKYYNRIVARDAIDSVDWQSSEKMHKITVQYQLGVTVDHNSDPVLPAGGSCIFLHIWKSANDPTSGCTAMTAENMQAIAAWLDGAQQPLLVQLTEPLYRQFKATWQLPEIGQ